MSSPSFIFGAQYFRPPFPEPHLWEDDVKRMRDAGLNALQMWLVWGWCEPEPGKFVFEDYDRLCDLAAANGLGVVMSVLPEINPFWLDRLLPEGRMIDVEGRPALGSNRTECLSGVVPGLCSDHPGVRERMMAFMTTCAGHFRPRANLLAWDVWNENRWRNHAPDMVCCCEHSLASLREFLRERYGSLEGLGKAWGRRYCDWRDVRVGRLAPGSYPELRDFTDWLCHRGREMARWRVEAVRAGDSTRLVSSHTGSPSIGGGVSLNETVFSRGIDWDIAEGDGYGFSSFPTGHNYTMSPVELAVRMNSCMTVGGGRKPGWMSEMQGGQFSISGQFGPPLPGAMQQAWTWLGISRGSKACVYWCWRNEIFSGETNGFGIHSPDGFTDDRVQHLRRTSAALQTHAAALDAYRPDDPQIAVLFQRDTYIFDWINSKNIFSSPYLAPDRFLAWPKSLERVHLPYAIHDDHHMPPLPQGLKLVVVPNAEGLCDEAARWLLDFAHAGGVVLLEGVAGMHRPDTYFRLPHERIIDATIGLRESLHRRTTQPMRDIPAGAIGNARAIRVHLDHQEQAYADGIACGPDGLTMVANIPHGRGRFICLGAVVGRLTSKESPAELDALVSSVAGLANVNAPVTVRGSAGGFVSASLGGAGGERLLFVVNLEQEQKVTLDMPRNLVGKNQPRDWFEHTLIVSSTDDRTRVELDMATCDHAVISWRH